MRLSVLVRFGAVRLPDKRARQGTAAETVEAEGWQIGTEVVYQRLVRIKNDSTIAYIRKDNIKGVTSLRIMFLELKLAKLISFCLLY